MRTCSSDAAGMPRFTNDSRISAKRFRLATTATYPQWAARAAATLSSSLSPMVATTAYAPSLCRAGSASGLATGSTP